MPPAETSFVRADGRRLQVVPGFRERVLASRPAMTPRPHWTPADYERAADKKLKRGLRLMSDVVRWQPLQPRRDRDTVLDVGCGDGINCLVLALLAGSRSVGLDLQPRLFDTTETGALARQLAALVLERLDASRTLDDALHELPVSFAKGDATTLPFPDNSIDVLISRSALEHIVPLECALSEMARAVRPGGVIHHAVDPYYWLRGCHKRGLVDIPWAHARLSLEDFRRFVTEREGETVAAKRCTRLQTLNRLTLAQWRGAVEAGPFEILEWIEEPVPFAVAVLDEYPDVVDSLADGVEPRDLVHGRLEFWLRVTKS
ncbi:MAG TPA: class I SAM-dependent methyltransferase [Gemmatimonadales bacterium]|nr:class I SAM-dependent methyltransferase [Gemmatimonadales bacterium]